MRDIDFDLVRTPLWDAGVVDLVLFYDFYALSDVLKVQSSSIVVVVGISKR